MRSSGGRCRMGEGRNNLRMHMHHSDDWLETALCKDSHAGFDLVRSHTGSVSDRHFGLTRKTCVFFMRTTSRKVASVGSSRAQNQGALVFGNLTCTMFECVAFGTLCRCDRDRASDGTVHCCRWVCRRGTVLCCHWVRCRGVHCCRCHVHCCRCHIRCCRCHIRCCRCHICCRRCHIRCC